MTATDTRTAEPDVLLLPENPPRLGPISRRLLMRPLAILVVMQALGAWLVFGNGSDTSVAAGLSLVYPGGGLLFVASPVLFAVSSLLMVLALVLWWGLSAHAAIPAAWMVCLGAAVALVDGPRVWGDRGETWGWAISAVYALTAAALVGVVWRFEKRYRAKKRRIPELNAYLSSVELPHREPMVREPDQMDAELARWCHDLAMQPDDGLKGLDWGEQFHGGTQLRYQLNAFCWAMSVYAVNFVPNAPVQVERSLARLVEKHTDLRVWRYWRTLNLLGNFDPNPDPIVRDNIMFSAFFGDVINMYEAATGSDRFDRPGSLTFVWKDGRTFEYDHHSITAAVRKNFDRSALGFFPCEPGWSFTVCNIMGAQSLLGHDTLHGSDEWAQVKPRWQRTLDEEYLTPDGSYAHIRSNHLGLSWDTGEVPGGHYFSNGSNRFADILPDHARRAAALELRGALPKLGALAGMVKGGRLELELPEVPERHRTRSSALPSWNNVIAGSRATGHPDLHIAALDASSRQCATGKRWPERPLKAGASALAAHMLIRWSAPLSTATLNVRGYRPPVGPVLDATSWDDVLVIAARSADGRSLRMTLEPWHAPQPAPVSFTFRQLEPGTTYRCSVDGVVVGELVAEADGRASMSFPVTSRIVVEVTP